MKRLLIAALAVMAALACMASIGVSTSYAGKKIVLCKAAEEPCAEKNVYPEGNNFVAEASATADQLEIYSTMGTAVRCKSSTIKGTIGSSLATGQSISLSAWELLSCTNPLTPPCTSEAEGLGSTGVQVDRYGDLLFTNPRLHFDCGGFSPTFHCTYGEKSGIQLFQGADHKSFGTGELSITQSGSFCDGENPHINVTYRVVAPEYALYPSWRPLAPAATTEVADHIRGTRATLHGKVNPNGEATNYWFECGKTTAYGTNVPATPKAAGSGTENVAVSEIDSGLEPSTTYHCRIVAESASKEVVKGEDISFTTAAAMSGTELSALGYADFFDGSSTSLADFESDFSALGWAGGTTPKGADSSTGWKSTVNFTSLNGIYYTPSLTDVGWGLAAIAKVGHRPTLENGAFSLWIDMPTPGSTKAGYQLNVKNVGVLGSPSYTLTLSKWVGGTQTELTSKAGYGLTENSSLALADQGSTVSVWVDSGSGFSQLMSSSDSSFEGGRAGFDSNEIFIRLKEFKAGALRSPNAETSASEAPYLRGNVNPEGLETKYWFEYGTTSAYGSKTSGWTAGSGTNSVPESEWVELAKKTTYHYRIIAENEAGTSYGMDKSFTTP